LRDPTPDEWQAIVAKARKDLAPLDDELVANETDQPIDSVDSKLFWARALKAEQALFDRLRDRQ
jgi:hypothetical protein